MKLEIYPEPIAEDAMNIMFDIDNMFPAEAEQEEWNQIAARLTKKYPRNWRAAYKSIRDWQVEEGVKRLKEKNNKACDEEYAGGLSDLNRLIETLTTARDIVWEAAKRDGYNFAKD